AVIQGTETYVAVVPDLSTDSSTNSFLQVTASNPANVIYLNIQKVCDGIVQTTFLPLSYIRARHIDISKSCGLYDM
ncbi:hypothetical protein BgiMline_031046, partial [Biomphalaria glabrata]